LGLLFLEVAFASKFLSFYGLSELGVRDLAVRVHIESADQSNHLVLGGVVPIVLEESTQVVLVDLALILLIHCSEACVC